MSISYEESGRRNQKARTRAALVEAARALLAGGVTPSVEAVAEAASISRATAYRYFPNRETLLLAAHPEIETESLLGPEPPSDPEARIDRVAAGLLDIYLAAEQTYRTMLRLSLESDVSDARDPGLRKGRRYLWIREALEPVRERLGPVAFERLVHGVAITIGIEAVVALVDLGRLPREEAVEVMRWSARSLLKSALAEAEEGTPG
ncbi:MAG: helix-turn-helix domain-containing protein [Gemmatimonadota bacterium]|jgi:AcrR family transcriptional regulator